MQHYRESAQRPQQRRFWVHNLGPMTALLGFFTVVVPALLTHELATGVDVACSAETNSCTLHLDHLWRTPVVTVDMRGVTEVRPSVDEKVRLGRGSLRLGGIGRTVDLHADVGISEFAAHVLDDFARERRAVEARYRDRGILVLPLLVLVLFALILGASTYLVRFELALEAGVLRLRARRWPWAETQLALPRSEVQSFDVVPVRRGRRSLTSLRIILTDGRSERLDAAYDLQPQRMDALVRALDDWLKAH